MRTRVVVIERSLGKCFYHLSNDASFQLEADERAGYNKGGKTRRCKKHICSALSQINIPGPTNHPRKISENRSQKIAREPSRGYAVHTRCCCCCCQRTIALYANKRLDEHPADLVPPISNPQLCILILTEIGIDIAQ